MDGLCDMVTCVYVSLLTLFYVHSRFHHENDDMHEVGNEVEVALGSSATTLSTERLLVGKSEQQQTKVM